MNQTQLTTTGGTPVSDYALGANPHNSSPEFTLTA